MLDGQGGRMHNTSRLVLKIVIGLLAPAFASLSAAAGTVLITEQEARLPSEQFTVPWRGISRAPQIELVELGASVQSPMHFQVKFRAFGGSEISVDTLQMTYLKTPEVDLVPRVARFLRSNGIDIPDAEIPPGDHFLRIAISDSNGRTRSSVIELKVAP
jgi:hypothetical protein